MKSKWVSVLGVSLAVSVACSAHEPEPGEGELGSLRAAVELSDVQHGLTAVRLDIVAPDEGCESPPLFTQTVPFESEASPGAEPGTHAFADALFVLAPGSYRVCATPLVGDEPSVDCQVTDAVAEVSSANTTELTLVSQCDGDVNGGLGVIVTLNDRPEIEQLTLDPSQFISVCESAQVTATASDPNDDELSYAWSVFSGPDGAILRADGASATFSGPAGDYTLSLDVDDAHGGVTTLRFPIHVSDAVCSVPDAVQDIFTARCSPCHTTGSSGGLHLDPASASFANLVGVGSSSAACASRTRVVPGDASASYLIAKLRGEAGICGLRMPRNLPPLPEEEIATIEAWINDLPH